MNISIEQIAQCLSELKSQLDYTLISPEQYFGALTGVYALVGKQAYHQAMEIANSNNR